MFQRIRVGWIRPALFFGNNPISLAGGAITSAAGVTMIAYWLIQIVGRPNANPYLGIIFFLLLPALFIAGLLLIPAGVFLRHRKLKNARQVPDQFPRVDLNDPVFRHGLDIVLVATIVNLLVVSVATYRGAAYMDSPQFCGQSCHVMHPEFAAYKISAHSHVACAECHIGTGAAAYFSAKLNGTKQLLEVTLHPVAHFAPRYIPDYPTPIPSPVKNLRPARAICETCHTPAKYAGEKLLIKTSFADDAKNTKTQTVLVLHLGGLDSLSHLSGIHGAHLGQIEYIASDPSRQTIPWVERRSSDESVTVFSSLPAGSSKPKGERRLMDCIDCHNRAAHKFATAEEALNQAMDDGGISSDLPWIHQEGLQLLQAAYASEADASTQIPMQLAAFYRTQHPEVLATRAAQVKSSANELVTLYNQNVFPFMKVDWGTHPNNIGHMSYPGCFRCHDGSHTAQSGKAITQDCSVCHNLLAVDEANPKILADLGIH